MPEFTCIECGVNKVNVSPSAQARGARAICKECRNKEITVTCIVCGNDFETKKRNARYCSDKCRLNRKRANTARLMRELTERRRTTYKPTLLHGYLDFNNIEMVGGNYGDNRMPDTHLGF